MIWALLLLFQTAPGSNAQNTINNKFSCDGRAPGYYADIQTGCQVYHMCDGLGRQFSYSCPNTTLFQQRMLICDHWYMVNCSKSEVDYAANLLIGQREKPFVDDSDENHPYHRTPRPDLLSHSHSDSEENAIYRSGRAYSKTNTLNVVGASTDGDFNGDESNSTNDAVYFLPSHWSIRYSKQPTSEQQVVSGNTKNRDRVAPNLSPSRRRVISTTETPATDKAANSISSRKAESGTEFPVNYKSRFKNTTPVFPKAVTTEIPVNFKSLFKNTTPVFPKVVGTSSSPTNSEDVTEFPVNFKSYFKNTTPSYPKTVDSDTLSLNVNEIGLLPPPLLSNNKVNTKTDNVNVRIPSTDFLPPAPDNSHLTRNQSENVQINPPSLFYQAPRFQPDYTIPAVAQTGNNRKREKSQETPLLLAESSTLSGRNKWKNLRNIFLIPEYDFPLETASRPGYDSKISSFQVK